MRLPERLADGPVRFRSGGEELAFTLRDAANPAVAVPSGSSVTYRHSLPGVDVRLTAQPDGIKEDLILAGPDAARAFTWRLETSKGITPRLADRGRSAQR